MNTTSSIWSPSLIDYPQPNATDTSFRIDVLEPNPESEGYEIIESFDF